MQHQAAHLRNPQLLRRRVLNQIQILLGHALVLQLDLGLRAAYVDVRARHADVDFLDLLIRFQLRRRDGIAHALDHLARSVPVAVLKAIIRHCAGTQKFQAIDTAILRYDRHDFGCTKFDGSYLRLAHICCSTTLSVRLAPDMCIYYDIIHGFDFTCKLETAKFCGFSQVSKFFQILTQVLSRKIWRKLTFMSGAGPILHSGRCRSRRIVRAAAAFHAQPSSPRAPGLQIGHRSFH